jgi:hypothetical protein
MEPTEIFKLRLAEISEEIYIKCIVLNVTLWLKQDNFSGVN